MNLSKDEIEKGQKAMKKARELSKPNLLSFRTKPDWDQTARWGKDAAAIFRRLGKQFEADYLECLDLSARGHENINSFNQAAIDREEVGDYIAKNQPSKSDQAIESYKYSARLYRLNSQIDRAAATYMKGSKVADEAKNPKVAFELMDSACAIFEDEDKPTNAETTFKMSLAFLLKQNDKSGAIRMIARQNALYKKRLDMFEADLHKNCLSEVIIWLSDGKLDEARQAQSQNEANVEKYPGSDPCSAAQDLLLAIERNPQEFDNVKKKHAIFKYLDNSVAKLAQKLTIASIPGAGKGSSAAAAGPPDTDSVSLR